VPQALTEGVMERRDAAFLAKAPSGRELAVPQALTEGVMERRVRRLPRKGSFHEEAGCELARRLREPGRQQSAYLQCGMRYRLPKRGRQPL